MRTQFSVAPMARCPTRSATSSAFGIASSSRAGCRAATGFTRATAAGMVPTCAPCACGSFLGASRVALSPTHQPMSRLGARSATAASSRIATASAPLCWAFRRGSQPVSHGWTRGCWMWETRQRRRRGSRTSRPRPGPLTPLSGRRRCSPGSGASTRTDAAFRRTTFSGSSRRSIPKWNGAGWRRSSRRRTPTRTASSMCRNS
mmetsp:Transcript_103219/g.291469  ORF Transcript_103219/g.291469 Transcript_103219/m.291469 type:complete len:203 (+) Transcript_103219:1021-1629(+)